MRLKDKTILITGANRGIGRALAEELAKRPVNLLLGMRDVSSFDPITSTTAISIKPIKVDLSSRESIDECLGNLKNDVEDLNILINNAGQFVAGPLQEQDLTEIYSMFQVNLVGLIHLTNKLLPILLNQEEGKIVNNASIAGYAYLPFNSSYSATKAGVVAFSESLRRELETTKVSVLHLVTPGVDTQLMKKVEATYNRPGRSISLKKISVSEWAVKVVEAIERDEKVLSPSGTTGILKIISRGPSSLVDIISRRIIN